MRGVDKMMNEMRGMGATRSGSKPHHGEDHREHRAMGGSMYGGRGRSSDRMERMERMEHQEMESSQRPSRPMRSQRREEMEERRPMRNMRPTQAPRHEEMDERRPMRRYATGGNVKAMEMKASGGEMPGTALVMKARKLNAVGPKETWNKKKVGGKVERQDKFLGGILNSIFPQRQGPSMMESLMSAGKGIANHLQESGANKAELARLRAAQTPAAGATSTAGAAPASTNLRKGGKVCRNRGGQMLGGAAMNRQAPQMGMSPTAATYSKGGKAKGEHREHHWMGAALGMALPILANLAGGALGGYFGGNKAEGGSIKRRRGGCVNRAVGGIAKERFDKED